MSKLGLQLYSVKEIALYDAIKLAADSGYDGVEFAGFFNKSASEVKKVLSDNGIHVCGSHTGIEELTGNLDKTIEYHLQLGNKYIVIPFLPEGLRKDEDDWKELAYKMNQINDKLNDNGIKLGYHNHAFEFKKYNGKYGFDILAQNTAPNIVLEIDTYWIAYAGLDTVEYIKKYKDRLELLHIKDLADDKTSTEIGRGNIDFKAVTKAADSTKWFIVEQEHYKIPQQESIKISSQYLKDII